LSLISEGLKKAHLETLRQDRENRREYFSPGRSDVPPRRSKRGSVLAAALGGAILAATVTATWISNVRAESSSALASPARPAPGEREPAKADTVAAAPESTPVMAARDSVDVPSGPKGSASEKRISNTETPITPAPAPSAPESTSAPEPASEPREKVAGVSADSRGPAEPRGRSRREGLVNGESYASPVRSPGGGEVRLSGFSSSGGQSVAIINGNVVREGESVGPFVVEKIERGRVQLRYADIRFWLSY
jgi:hypothetical protein